MKEEKEKIKDLEKSWEQKRGKDKRFKNERKKVRDLRMK